MLSLSAFVFCIQLSSFLSFSSHHYLPLLSYLSRLRNMADIELGTQATLHLQDKLGVTSVLEAKKASDAEHEETAWVALKKNRKAVFWSVVVSMSVIMEGYDTILISNFIGYPRFAEKYGHDYGPGQGYLISTPWQQGISMGSTVGAIFGTFFIRGSVSRSIILSLLIRQAAS